MMASVLHLFEASEVFSNLGTFMVACFFYLYETFTLSLWL